MTQPARRELPPRANFAEQKSQARELLQAFDRHDRDAVTRVRAVLPDKVRIVLADAQFVLSREYGFTNWPALKHHLEARAQAMRAPHEQLHDAMMCGDAATARELLSRHPEFRPMINVPLFAFNAPALVACAGDADMVEVLLEFGGDPNQRSTWWAGCFHSLHSATGLAAERLLAAGAVPDACAAAHLDDAPLLASILAATPSRVHERGGDGQRRFTSRVHAVWWPCCSTQAPTSMLAMWTIAPRLLSGCWRKRVARVAGNSRATLLSAAPRATSFSRRRSAARAKRSRCSSAMPRFSTCRQVAARTASNHRPAITSTSGQSAAIARRWTWRRSSGMTRRSLRCSRSRRHCSGSGSRVGAPMPVRRGRSRHSIPT